MRNAGTLFLLLTILPVWSAGALDFSGRVLSFHEDYTGEVAFPTSPELDALGLGGLVASPPGGPTLTGSAARAALVADGSPIQSGFVNLLGPVLVGSGRFGQRSEFVGFQVVDQSLGSVADAGVTATYESPVGDPSIFLARLVSVLDPTLGLVTVFILQEQDAMGTVVGSDSIEFSGTQIESAILAGEPFTIDLSVDLGLSVPIAEASIAVAGDEFGVSIAVSTLPDGGTLTSLSQRGQLFFGDPPMSFQLDMESFELYLEPGANRINVDVGASEGTPSRLYAAAGEPGVWNSIPTTGAHPLVRADGSASPASLTLSALTAGITPGSASSDVLALLGDEATDCAAVPTSWTLDFSGLENGDYDVTLYAPADAAMPTGPLMVEGLVSPSLPGDAGLALVQGVSYERFLRPVTDGTLTISGTDFQFQTFCIGVSGVQLERRLPAVPSLSPPALATLALTLAALASWLAVWAPHERGARKARRSPRGKRSAGWPPAR